MSTNTTVVGSPSPATPPISPAVMQKSQNDEVKRIKTVLDSALKEINNAESKITNTQNSSITTEGSVESAPIEEVKGEVSSGSAHQSSEAGKETKTPIEAASSKTSLLATLAKTASNVIGVTIQTPVHYLAQQKTLNSNDVLRGHAAKNRAAIVKFIKKSYLGSIPSFTLGIPSSLAMFATWSTVTKKLSSIFPNHEAFTNFAGITLGTGLESALKHPFSTVRLQAQIDPAKISVLKKSREMYKGVKGIVNKFGVFYKGFWVNTTHLIVFNNLFFPATSCLTSKIKDKGRNFTLAQNICFEVVSGGFSAAFASTITRPLQVVGLVQRANIDNKNEKIIAIGSRILKEEGILGLWKGHGTSLFGIIARGSGYAASFALFTHQLRKFGYLEKEEASA